ncbi:hypothetical protein DSUL_170059 [Desulfovibrionales bacterium]
MISFLTRNIKQQSETVQKKILNTSVKGCNNIVLGIVQTDVVVGQV